MKLDGLIYQLSGHLKLLIVVFLIVLSIGFFTGLSFVYETSSFNSVGIEENYLGNENDEDANIMKFKKSRREMLSIIHSHMLSMSMIFFVLGLLLSIAKLPKKLKLFLMIEPLISVLLTFGGLYFLWLELLWMKYVVMVSGVFMVLTFFVAVTVLLTQCLPKRNNLKY